MSKTVKDGEFYVTNRKTQEKSLKKDLDGIEGFDVISRLTQKKNPSNFDIPQNADPGQMVMCETDKIRYVKLNQSGNFLTIQQVEVYDENGTNVALVRESVNNNYKLTDGDRPPGTPIATMNSYYPGTNPYMALDGNVSATEVWPNSACTASPSGGWWEVDLGKLVNVKKIVIYNRPDCCQDRLNGTTVSVIDRNQNTVWSTTLNSNRRQEFNINLTKQNCGGPVIEKNLDDFEELKELQIQYNRELHTYNQSIKDRLDNSRKYISASNKSNNKLANKWILDDKSGQLGYVTERGTYKYLSTPAMGNSIQGNNGCPNGWGTNYTKTTPDDGQDFSIGQAPVGEMVKTNGVELIKGTNLINNQSCNQSGKNVFVTEPQLATNLRYTQCSKNAGSYQSDLAVTTFDACKQRAADVGSNVFSMGPNYGNSAGQCFIGGGGSGIVKDSLCSVTGNDKRMGRNVAGKWVKSGWIGWRYQEPYTAYAIYNTDYANNTNLNQTFHITDDLEAKLIPSGPMNKIGVVNAPSEFQVINNFDSAGYDITGGQGNSSNIEDIKKKCIETPGCAGFVYSPSTGQYYLKNANMWPKGNRNISPGLNLYIRTPTLDLNSSCNSNNIETITQNMFNYSLGSTMDSSTTCALGTISSRDLQNDNLQYKKLNAILEKMHSKIIHLGGEDIQLNNRLLGQYNLMTNRLKKYEQVYSSIEKTSKLTKHDTALEEDATLNMLSNDKKFMLWSIAAMGITAAALKFMK